MDVLKRDKTIEAFQFSKIEMALNKAFISCGYENTPEDVLECMASKYDIETDEPIDVENIQDNIEQCLMELYPDVAKPYMIYRYEHKVMREQNTSLVKNLKKKLMAQEVENQNANVDEYSFGGRIGEATRYMTKEFALDNCMSRKSRKNHLNNEIYIHDLDSYAVGEHNCLSIPFDDLLKNGFKVRQTDIRPARSINTAFQLVAVLFQVQSLQQFGGVSATHIDWTMVPYVRLSFRKHYVDGLEYIADKVIDKDDIAEDTPIDSEEYRKNEKVYRYAMNMTEKELNQAVEAMYHNLNSLQSRSGWANSDCRLAA